MSDTERENEARAAEQRAGRERGGESGHKSGHKPGHESNHEPSHESGHEAARAQPGAHGKDVPPDDVPDRSIAGRPIDPNSATAKVRFPPGVSAEEARDPGRQTPGAPPVDNRSGERR